MRISMRSTSGKTALTNLPRLSPHRSLRAQIIHHLFKGGGHLQTLMFEAVTPPALALIVSSNSAVVELSSRLDRKALRATEADGDRQLGGRDGSPLADGISTRNASKTHARLTAAAASSCPKAAAAERLAAAMGVFGAIANCIAD